MTPTSWNERFTLIDAYNPGPSSICAAFNCTMDQLRTAIILRNAGTFQPSPDINVDDYVDLFPSVDNDTLTIKELETEIASSPQTATQRAKKISTPKKRGRKGNKIITALLNIPTVPIAVDEFVEQYDISVAVLRQSKRFIISVDVETQKQIGTIKVRQDKTTKQLMVWKELPLSKETKNG